MYSIPTEDAQWQITDAIECMDGEAIAELYKLIFGQVRDASYNEETDEIDVEEYDSDEE